MTIFCKSHWKVSDHALKCQAQTWRNINLLWQPRLQVCMTHTLGIDLDSSQKCHLCTWFIVSMSFWCSQRAKQNKNQSQNISNWRVTLLGGRVVVHWRSLSQSIPRAMSFHFGCAVSHQVDSSTLSQDSTGCANQSWPCLTLPHVPPMLHHRLWPESLSEQYPHIAEALCQSLRLYLLTQGCIIWPEVVLSDPRL